ncbi:MAG: cytochrome c biogenesis protein CcdA [bacterium]
MTWYDASLHQMAERLFSSDISPVAYPLVFLAGLLTNFCPCNVALVPLVIGLAGGFSRSKERARAALYSVVFAAGIVVTLCGLGVLAALAGAALAPARTVCLWLIAIIAVAMGLHCLGVANIPLPGLDGLPAGKRKGLGGTFLLGLMAGAVASPCTTPVLAVILTYVAVQARLLYGVSLLLTYAAGFVVPLILAGLFADFILRLDRLQKKTGYRDWIGKGSGVLLIVFGVYLAITAVWS